MSDPTPHPLATLFTRADGSFLCARWGRPLAPVIFGLAEDQLPLFHDVFAAVVRDAGVTLAETDPEMGANLMVFFCRDWDELADLPDLDRLTGLPDLPARLAGENADSYRLFRFDADGGIRACLSFVRITGAFCDLHPAALGERLAVNAMLTFAREVTPSAHLREVIRAAYAPVLPVAARDAAHALRLAARMGT